MRIFTTIDTIWLNVVLRASPNWTSQMSYDVVESLLRKLSLCAALMSFVPIANKWLEPLEAAHVSIDDDRYDVAE